MEHQSPSPFSLHQITTYQAGIIQATVHRQLQRECDLLLKEFGITKMHWIIIGTVLDAGDEGIRITDLAEVLQTGLSYLTTAVNYLERNHILLRQENLADGRSKVVYVDPDFAPRCGEIEMRLREHLRNTIYTKVSAEDFEIYMRVLFKLSQV